MTDQLPKITFGMIVLNGEPFIRYNLRALYPLAHEIIVVEGASPNAAHAATPDGHSLDGTLQTLQQFKSMNDPDGKIRIVTAEDEGYLSGFWPGEKDEQSQAYAKRATGDWLWQIDVDEFYLASDMQRIAERLLADPSITAVTFPEMPFWGSFDYWCDGIFLRMQYSKFHRLFRWGENYQMTTHRPPTVVNAEGVDLRKLHWLTDQDLRQMGIFLYHYTQIFPKQVRSKMTYYERLMNDPKNLSRAIRDTDHWFSDTYLSLRNPYRVHTVNTWPSWLVRFAGTHPEQVQELKLALERGDISIPIRDMRDVDELVSTRRYQAGIVVLKLWGNYVSQTNRICRDFVRRRIGFGQLLRGLLAIAVGKQRLFREI